MSWNADDSRKDLQAMLGAIERQATDLLALAGQAQRDMDGNRFSSFLTFRKKVEEVRALLILTEERLKAAHDPKLVDLHAEFERMDLLLTSLFANSTRDYFANIREDQALPIGARELFEPELRILEETRAKLSRPPYADRVAPGLLTELEETAGLIRKTLDRAPSLPDFSDAESMPKPLRRLRRLGRPIRS